MNTIELRWHEQHASPCRSVEITVDGEPLEVIVQGVDPTFEASGIDSRFSPMLQHFLGDAPISDDPELRGLVPLFVCPACGECLCGGLSVSVVVGDSYVDWVRYDHPRGTLSPEDLAKLPIFRFPRASYETAARELDRDATAQGVSS